MLSLRKLLLAALVTLPAVTLAALVTLPVDKAYASSGFTDDFRARFGLPLGNAGADNTLWSVTVYPFYCEANRSMLVIWPAVPEQIQGVYIWTNDPAQIAMVMPYCATGKPFNIRSSNGRTWIPSVSYAATPQ